MFVIIPRVSAFCPSAATPSRRILSLGHRRRRAAPVRGVARERVGAGAHPGCRLPPTPPFARARTIDTNMPSASQAPAFSRCVTTGLPEPGRAASVKDGRDRETKNVPWRRRPAGRQSSTTSWPLMTTPEIAHDRHQVAAVDIHAVTPDVGEGADHGTRP